MLEQIELPFDWTENVPGAKEYDEKLRKHNEKGMAADGDDAPDVRIVSHHKWEDDIGERARRLWEWWKVRRDIVAAWALALRLIILVNPSSCGVERVFSQIKLIIESCGTSMTEKLLELRAFIRCNGELF